ncbi:ERF family protein [Maricaulis sp.]|uniref:ERF family protein n=1 Tax=Maricaulis sp. TaxID=1486257 RepID=UPI00262E9020|nr:ERF family protein [Maricaulis sp.]MDF1769864.1 ERF family protein [Maricaulis sp.]
MQRSESIAALAAALAAAQAEMEAARKDSTNPHFKSSYADLRSAWEACRGPLTKNGLAIAQFACTEEGGAGVETVLTHKSGEWMSEKLILPIGKRDAQGCGSAITYARRYALMAIAGVAADDDDGNEASKGQPAAERPAAKPRSAVKAAEAGKAPKAADPSKPAAIAPVSEADPDIRAWAGTFANAIKVAPTTDAMDAWFEKNAGTLNRLQEIAPNLSGRLDQIRNERASALTETEKEAAE